MQWPPDDQTAVFLGTFRLACGCRTNPQLRNTQVSHVNLASVQAWECRHSVKNCPSFSSPSFQSPYHQQTRKRMSLSPWISVQPWSHTVIGVIMTDGVTFGFPPAKPIIGLRTRGAIGSTPRTGVGTGPARKTKMTGAGPSTRAKPEQPGKKAGEHGKPEHSKAAEEAKPEQPAKKAPERHGKTVEEGRPNGKAADEAKPEQRGSHAAEQGKSEPGKRSAAEGKKHAGKGAQGSEGSLQ